MTSSALKQKCPGGHVLPHSGDRGRCTPIRCAVDPGVKKTRRQKDEEKNQKIKNTKQTFALRRNDALEHGVKKLVREASKEPVPIPRAGSITLANEGRIEQFAEGSIAAGKHFARMAFINDLPAPDADAVAINNWADERVVKLLPLAIAEKEFQLKFGDDDQRERAADRILAMNGRSTKDQHLSGGAVIILQQGGDGTIQLPYAPKKLKEQTTVDAEVVEAKDA